MRLFVLLYMKLILRISILVSALIALSFSAVAKVTLHNVILSDDWELERFQGKSLRVMSYNIRYSGAKDGEQMSVFYDSKRFNLLKMGHLLAE